MSSPVASLASASSPVASLASASSPVASLASASSPVASLAPVTVLVANRGEIARRVFATCRRLGIGTVAVYSDADADAPHVRDADAAVRLPGNTPTDTYLRADLVIAAARAAGADAVHPGYGFLSENAEFARAVLDAGLTWVGPPVAAIASMGSKVESKKLMDSAGVPVLTELDPGLVTEADLPVLIKASAGGGGRGMRVVRALADLPDQIGAARREAESAFGDATMFCERYLESGRHIEVQIMADRHGTVWAVGERECSIQRRHQKVIEEAPSPLVERVDGMRERLFEAAVRAGQAVRYEGAGTVEFLADDTGEFYFLEMNTRLQVEHPVTELTTGLDLVALQLQVAGGARLPATPPVPRGHAIEVRLYAEDPARDWQPQSGPVHRFEVPGVLAEFANPTGAGIRLDSGVVDGSVVGVHYDPMLAKVIGFADERGAAAHLLATTLARSRIHGLTTNRDLLVRTLRHPAFLAGDTDTAFFATHDLAALSAPVADADTVELSAVAAALADAAANRAATPVARGIPGGWRNVGGYPQRKTYLDAAGAEHEVRYRQTRTGPAVESAQPATVGTVAHDAVVLEQAGVARRYDVARYEGGLVCVDSPRGSVTFTRKPRFVDPADQVASGSLLAPMPGTVIRVAVQVGDQVRAGDPLLWLEAMKMEHTIAAVADGVVAELDVEVGRQVEVGAVLAVIDAAENPEEDR